LAQNLGCVADEGLIREKYRLLRPHLDERCLRLWAAAEAVSLGYGGVIAVAQATGVSRTRIQRGRQELSGEEPLERGRVRRRGAGRKPLSETDLTLVDDLERLADDEGRGDPERPLRWTSKSHFKLAEGLRSLGHRVCARSLAPLLRGLGYSLQANAKVKEGKQHPDRDAQFRHINERVSAALEAGEPTISVDTKKKELIGEFKNGGRELRPKGSPAPVNTHDFPSDALGKAIPYGILDIAANQGFVSVGIDHDTAQFSVASIRAWWEQLGRERYRAAKTLTITADCGGSNGNRTRLWKTELQGLADETGLAIQVCHFPPGTSKWNKVEHRLWSFVSHNWRAKPLISYEVIVSLIAATTTRTGLKVYARLDERDYPTKIQVSDAELAAVNLHGDQFHPEWNYTIGPRAP
jgi:hypothetical protein